MRKKFQQIVELGKYPKFRLIPNYGTKKASILPVDRQEKQALRLVAGYWWSEIVDVCNCDNRRKWQMLHFAYNKNEAVGLPAHRHLKRNQYPATLHNVDLSRNFECLLELGIVS